MTPDALNCAANLTKGLRRLEANGRIITPEFSGQAAPTTRGVVQVKTGAFKVEFSRGTLVVKKSARKK